MSVKVCGRQSCKTMMCDRCILERSYYICEECWEELLDHRESWPTEMSAQEVWKAIVDFMHTAPGNYRKLDAEGIENEFKRLTDL